MPLYFLLLDHAVFQDHLRPALSASWRERSFDACVPLCRSLLPRVEEFARQYYTQPGQTLLAQVPHGLTFDRPCWRTLAGELLWFAAEEIPEIEVSADTLCHLLAPGHPVASETPREQFAPIQQALHGARDLLFGGGFYRPQAAGLNDFADVVRLSAYLAAVKPEDWDPSQLTGLEELPTEEDRTEELEYLREWFPALLDLYRRAEERRWVVVCEQL
jgi:hypothetical protein